MAPSSLLTATAAKRPRSKKHQRGSVEDPSNRYVGAHVSASGGCVKAVKNACAKLGPRARSFAFFIRPRLTWTPQPPIPADSVCMFMDSVLESQFSLDKIVVHGSYLINFGSHDAELRSKSVELMIEEVNKCEQLSISLYVFHPGSSTGHEHSSTKKSKSKKRQTRSKKSKRDERSDSESQSSGTSDDDGRGERAIDAARDQARAASLDYVAACVVEVLSRTRGVTLLIENTCGQGNVVGRDFVELRTILDAAVDKSGKDGSIGTRIGVCLDTCHAFASGYAMNSAKACERMMLKFDNAMGPLAGKKILKAVHVNDSRDPVGSKRDRHANIGKGAMSIDTFLWLMQSPRFEDIPLILETPRHEQRKRKSKKARKNASDLDAENATEVGPSAQEEVELLLDLCHI